MKLLVDVHCFDYSTSEGINTYLKGLYCALTKIATDIDFYFAAHEVDKVRQIFGRSSNVHYVLLTEAGRVKRLLTEFPAIIRRHGIDAAHYQYTSPLIKNCFTIITLHDILFKDYPGMFPLSYRLSKDLLFKVSARRADMLLTVSEYSRDRIAHHYGIPKENIHVTTNAVSEDFFDIDWDAAVKFTHSKGVDKYLLYVSRIEPRKNQIALLRAYNELKLSEKGYDLVFIGRKTIVSSEFDNYLNSMDETVRSHVHVYNQVNYEELKFWYRAASLFVYPALAEGFGIPPIEAGAAGVPCVCSNRTAMGDFTFFGSNLIDVTDGELLKQAILSNINGSDETELKATQKAIKNKYSWDAIAVEYYKQLKSSIQNGR